MKKGDKVRVIHEASCASEFWGKTGQITGKNDHLLEVAFDDAIERVVPAKAFDDEGVEAMTKDDQGNQIYTTVTKESVVALLEPDDIEAA